jgi:hypothetical protein
MTNHQTSKAKFFTVTVKLFDVVDRATPWGCDGFKKW